MTLPIKRVKTDQQPKFSDRFGRAQPILATGTLLIFSLLLGIPVLYLLNAAFPPATAPVDLAAQFKLGAAYRDIFGPVVNPLSALIAIKGGLSLAGILITALGIFLFAWALAMTLINQWRAQIPLIEDIPPGRVLIAAVLTLTLVSALFGITQLETLRVNAAQNLIPALILHFGFGFIVVLGWYFALTRAFIAWRALVFNALSVSFTITVLVWTLEVLIPDTPTSQIQGFFVLAHLSGFWLIVILGVHGLARQALDLSDWHDLKAFTRGQQVDFGLAILNVLGHRNADDRWMSSRAIAKSLGANHSLCIQALHRLNAAQLVRTGKAANALAHWCLSTQSLQALRLQDVIHAFDASLDPRNGIYENGPQQALIDLANQEARIFRADLASLGHTDLDPALGPDPMTLLSLVAARGATAQTHATGAPPPVTDAPQTYERVAALLEKNLHDEKPPASQLTRSYPAFALPLMTKDTDTAQAPALGRGLLENTTLHDEDEGEERS